MKNIFVEIGKDHYQTKIKARQHELIADEPPSENGTDLGFTPDELLAAALGSCTVITLRMYADRKGYDLEKISVSLEFERKKESGKTSTFISRKIELIGDLSTEVRERMLQIANLCPVHQTLTSPIEIQTSYV
ncbi:MAG: OsmC family peroxiredoxin [Flavobacterium sp.]|nr:MAG: OsmC family peroxiredoxin [Flavobacterium sp.]